MGLIQRLFKTERRAVDEESETFLETNSALLKALVGSSEITAETALEIPAFSAAVDFISTTVAMLPIKLYKENSQHRKTEEVTDDRRLFLLNDEADTLMNAFEAKRAQVRDMLIYGAGYAFIDRNGGALRYVKNGNVSVMKNSDPIFREADILVGGRHYFPFDFVILTRNSEDGVTGVGAVKEHNTLLSAMYNLIKYENAVSKTGGNRKGFLQANHKLAKPVLDEMKQAWAELYSNNSNNMMILNDGVTYAPSASSAVEMQLNESKESNSDQIASIFGLSTAVISGKAGTQEYMSAVRTAVLPIVEAYQAALNRALLAESEKGQMYFALDTTELLKGDTLSRYQAYAVGLQNNFLQIDEVRYMEDREPIGFDYVKLGLQDVLLDPKTGTIYTPNTNQLAKMGEQLLQNPLESGIIEERERQWKKGDHGYFAGSVSDGGGGSSKMTRREYNRVSHEIFTNNPLLKVGSSHTSFYGDFFYGYSVVEPGTYKFDLKMKIEGNEEKIKMWRQNNE